MKFLDRIALNRLVLIITNFVLSLLKMFSPKKDLDNIDVPDIKPVPDKKPILPWRRKKKNEESN